METSQRQTSPSGEDKSTCLLEDSLASLSALPDEEGERRITVFSGQKCCELLPKSNPLTSLAKTLLESSRMFSPAMRLKWQLKPLFSERIVTRRRDGSSLSSESAETLSEKDIQSSRLSFQLVPSDRHTGETACGSSQKAMLPTPNAGEGIKWNTTYNPNHQMASGLTAMAVNGLLPTPRVGGQESYETRAKRKGHDIAMSYLESAGDFLVRDSLDYDGETSLRLSPLFVSEMMGYPSEYLLYPFLSQNGKTNH